MWGVRSSFGKSRGQLEGCHGLALDPQRGIRPARCSALANIDLPLRFASETRMVGKGGEVHLEMIANLGLGQLHHNCYQLLKHERLLLVDMVSF
jgi:hypothetical protein